MARSAQKDDKSLDGTLRGRVLIIEEVQKRYRHYTDIVSGYKGLMMFTIFMVLYLNVLKHQHRGRSLLGPNEAIQVFIDLQKADLKVTDSASIYNTMSTTLIPALLDGSWRNSSDLFGRTSFEYYKPIGGVIITAVKGKDHNCFLGNPCFSAEPLDAPFYTFSLPGTAGTFSVPYNHDLAGYSVSVPSSTSQENIDALLSAYAGLFGPDTREVWLHAVLFNPSGEKTVTSLAYGGKMSLSSMSKFYLDAKTIPYHHYQLDIQISQIILECMTLFYGLWAMSIPLMIYIFFEPPLEGDDFEHETELRRKWLWWVSQWSHLPKTGGSPMFFLASSIQVLLVIAIIVWMYLGVLHSRLGTFGQEFRLFHDPLLDAGPDISAKMHAAVEAMGHRALPFVGLVNLMSKAYSRYFFIHVCTIGVLILRLNQYFAFQKRLSMVCDTFHGIFDDLLHIGMVLMLICYFCGVMNSLAYGVYDPAFQNFTESFVMMILSTFGLYRPAGSNPYVFQLFKYSPHLFSSAEFMAWLPMLLQVFFKALVMLFIFKLLMGVVMESYKRHSRAKAAASPVREDLRELGIQLYHKLWENCILRRPYVSFFHVARALAALQPSEDKPWETHVLGLDQWQSVQDALNNASAGASRHAKLQIESYQFKACGPKEVAYVLRVYGRNRSNAESHYAQICIDKAMQQFDDDDTERMEHRAKKKEVADVKDQAVAELQEQLNASRRQSGVPARIILHKKTFSSKELREIFSEYDLSGLGCVNHCFLPMLIHRLGFRIPRTKLSIIIDNHNDDEDGNVDLKELTKIVNDHRLIRHYQGWARMHTDPSQKQPRPARIPLLAGQV